MLKTVIKYHIININMDEYYNPKDEYIKHLKNLASYDSDGRFHGASRKWIEEYEETESWSNMGGA